MVSESKSVREILFRGKRKDNGEWVEAFSICKCKLGDEWVYYLGASQNSVMKMDMNYNLISAETLDDFLFYAIDPETIGQFTGRVDKNGNRVFEGDIIRITAFAPNIFVGVILWDDHDQCYLIVKDPSEQIHIDDFGNYGKPSYYEVIGNIYDNPELLEVEDG